MDAWLNEALDYVRSWLAFQLRLTGQTGIMLAVAHKGDIVLEEAIGFADLMAREPLTPRHRFRVASHSKSFTAAGIMRLREEGRLGLDEAVGRHVAGLHPEVAQTTIAQLLSHSAGLTRDGDAGGQFSDRTPYASAEEVLADIAGPPLIDPNTRFKYSNHGFALLGMVIAAVTGEPYGVWMRREIVAAFGLEETEPDMPLAAGIPFARGHTQALPLDRRLVIPGDYETHAVASAGGFVSTAADLARFFAQLSPEAAASPLSVASRREMTRPQWGNPDTAFERHYGLGIISGKLGDWEWFGHSGGLLGYVSRSCVVPKQDLSISLLANSVDSPTWLWLDGILHILQAWAKRGAASAEVRGWDGRWWSAWGCVDLLPMGDRVLMAVPALLNPVGEAAEIEVIGPDSGKVVRADGYGHYGETVRRVRNDAGETVEFWMMGSQLVPEAVLADDLTRRYGGTPG
jgi:CubicO group peptidase (beta-lactamase class C family)